MIKDREFSERLERILDNDSKPRFVKLLQNHPAEITKFLVEKCAEFGARKCCLLCSMGNYVNSMLFLHLMLTHLTMLQRLPMLLIAVLNPDAQIIDLMLMRCNAIPLVNVSYTIASVHVLPIHFVLLRLSYVEHIYPWTRGDSLVKLVYLLCLWKMVGYFLLFTPCNVPLEQCCKQSVD